jgi:hypothetical protein
MDIGGTFYSCFSSLKNSASTEWVAVGLVVTYVQSFRRTFAGMITFRGCMEWVNFSTVGMGNRSGLGMIKRFLFFGSWPIVASKRGWQLAQIITKTSHCSSEYRLS